MQSLPSLSILLWPYLGSRPTEMFLRESLLTSLEELGKYGLFAKVGNLSTRTIKEDA